MLAFLRSMWTAPTSTKLDDDDDDQGKCSTDEKRRLLSFSSSTHYPQCLMPDAAGSPARPSLTPSTSYATFQTPVNSRTHQYGMLSAGGHDDSQQRRNSSRSRRSRSERVSRHRAASEGGATAAGHHSLTRRFSRTSESGRSSSRRFHRQSGTFILGHPTTTFEAISAYSPRVSALIVDADEEGNDPEIGIVHDDLLDDEEDEDDIPYGVRKMELLQLKPITVWWGVLLISTFTALSSTTTPAVEPFLVSLFGGHNVLSSIAVMTSIAYAVFKPPMARIIDVFGRAEGLALSAALYSLGYILTSMSNNIVSFAVARLIGSAGAQGINLAQQIILADITTLASRGFYVATQFTPWLLAPWIGPPIGQAFKDMGEKGWRTVYFLSGIIVPVSCFALIVLLWTAYRRSRSIAKASQNAIAALKDHSPNVAVSESLLWQPRKAIDLAREIRNELDLRGNFYLMTGCTLLLLPLSLAANRPNAWRDPLYPSLAVLGIAVLCLLGYHETYIAQHPLLPPRMLKHRTVMAGCLLGASHFFCQFAYESYFPSFLQVARNYSARDASYVSESYVFSATIAALLCGGLIRYTKSYKIWVIFGVFLHMVGAVMMVRLRSLTTSTWEIVLSQIISGFGGGFTTLAMQLGVQATVAHTDVAIATAILLTITQIGGAVGGAASGIIWTTWLPSKLSANLPNATPEEIAKIFGSMSVALSYEPGTPERDGINRAYFDVQRMLNLTALVGLIPALLSALMMENARMGHERSADAVRRMPMGEALDVDFSDDDETGSSVVSYEHTPLRRSIRS